MAKKGKFKPSGKLDVVSDKLYSREEGFEKAPPTIDLEEEQKGGQILPEVPSDWGGEGFAEKEPVDGQFPKVKEISMKLLKKFLIFSLLFFVVSVAVAAVVFLRGGNQVSTENVDIKIAGPVSIGAGETLSYDISFVNNNNIGLEGASFLIEYPRGTRNADNGQELLRESRFLGDIPPGGTLNFHRQAILFGETNDSRTIIVSIEYRVKDSSATYFKEKNYDVLISTSPVSLTVGSFGEVISGQEFEFSVEVVSNSPTVINDMLLRVEYPHGFEFVSASPAASFGNNVFTIGDLVPSEKRIYKIRGRLRGQENEERNFAFNLGTRDPNNQQLLGTVFVISNRTVAIKRPFMSLSLLLNGTNEESPSVDAGKRVVGYIGWTNNLPTRMTDLEISAKVAGRFVRTSVSASTGFYRSIDDTLVWNKATNNSLAVVSPSESGSVDFYFDILPTSSLVYGTTKGHTVDIEISVKARRLSDANVPEEITSSVTRTIKIDSEIGLRGHSLYFTGPLNNQGPIPPTAERNTTYTVVWSLVNTLNNLSGTVVRASLPTYATFAGTVSPNSEAVTYDPLSGEVVWNAGDLKAGTGFADPVREVAFQISIVPSLSQLGQTPVIIGPASVTASDRFTGRTVRSSIKEITTAIEDAFMYGGEATKVVAP